MTRIPKIYTIDEVAAHLKISPLTARDWIYKGKIRKFKMGDLVRVHEDDLNKFIQDSSGNYQPINTPDEE